MSVKVERAVVVQSDGLDSKAVQPSASSRKPPAHRRGSRHLRATGVLLVPVSVLGLTVLAGQHLLPLVTAQGFHGPEALALILVVMIEAVALWFLVWAALALLSTVRLLPARFRSRLATSVISYAPTTAKTIASRALVSTAIAGSALVGPVAFAQELDSGVDDLLWDTATATTDVLDAAASEAQEVWLPGAATEAVPGENSESWTATAHNPTEAQASPQTQVQAETPVPSTTPAGAEMGEPERADAAPTHASAATSSAKGPAPKTDEVTRRGASKYAARHQLRDQELTSGSIGSTANRPVRSAKTEPEIIDEARVAETLSYTVEPGDCLWNIAKAQLPQSAGDQEIEEAWKQIYQDNQDIIGSDPNLIEPGQVLSLRG